MAAAQNTTKIEWEAEPDFRGDMFSLCKRYSIGEWVDDDRFRYEVRDHQTGRAWEYANSYSEAQRIAEGWAAAE